MKPARAPAPRQIKTLTHHHGIAREDEFAWLRADAWQDVLRDPSALPDEIRRHLEAENDYAAQLLSPVSKLTQKLLDEMKARIPQGRRNRPPDRWRLRLLAAL